MMIFTEMQLMHCHHRENFEGNVQFGELYCTF